MEGGLWLRERERNAHSDELTESRLCFQVKFGYFISYTTFLLDPIQLFCLILYNFFASHNHSQLLELPWFSLPGSDTVFVWKCDEESMGQKCLTAYFLHINLEFLHISCQRHCPLPHTYLLLFGRW